MTRRFAVPDAFPEDAGSDLPTARAVPHPVPSSSGTRRAVVLATNIYGYIDGGWRMLAHHASLPLVETQSADSQALLH